MKLCRVSLKLSLVVALSAMVLTGCPDDGVVRDGVIIVDDFDGLDLKALWDDFCSFFTGGDNPIQAGDILVCTDQGGFLRRVLSVGESGDTVTTETEMASLSDAVEEGILLETIEFTADDYKRAGVLPKDAKMTVVDFSGTELYRDYGLIVDVPTGRLDCTPTMNLGASWDKAQLESFNMTLTGDVMFDFDVRVAVDQGYPLSFETNVIPPITQPFATTVGPVPVVGVARLSFPVGVIGTFDGDTSVQAGFDVTTDFSVGATWTPAGWGETHELGEIVFTGHEPIWSVEVGADLQAYIRVVGSVSLYESLDLSAFAQPYLTADIDLYPVQTLAMAGGINAGGSYGLSIFDWRIAGDSYTWYGPSWDLFTLTSE
jgi:hypothetical protein